MGFIFAAFTAGSNPKITPIKVENTTLIKIADTSIATGICIMLEINSARPIPLTTPMIPPRLVRTAMLLAMRLFGLGKKSIDSRSMMRTEKVLE